MRRGRSTLSVLRLLVVPKPPPAGRKTSPASRQQQQAAAATSRSDRTPQRPYAAAHTHHPTLASGMSMEPLAAEEGFVDVSSDGDGGLLKKVLVEGSGDDSPPDGNEVVEHYIVAVGPEHEVVKGNKENAAWCRAALA